MADAAVVNREGRSSSTAFDAAVLQRSAPELLEIAHAVRDLVYDVYPETVEVVWPRQGSIGWGIGPKKMSEHFCYLLPFKQHVTLGFYNGAELDDPAGLLRSGTANVAMRSLKIVSLEDALRRQLRALIEEAVRDIRDRPNVDSDGG